MKRRNVIVLLLLIISIISISVVGVAIRVKSKDDLTERLKDYIIPIETSSAKSGFEDLKPFANILKDKKIVGMGEATHGTAEFFQMKHRMFEFLVEEMDFRLLVMEVQFGDGQIINDYILNGNGTLANCSIALKQWTANSNETLEMIQWMREFNDGRDYEDKIKFYGYDMQGIDGNLKQIVPYMEKVKSKVIFNKENLRIFFQPYYDPKNHELETFKRDIDNISKDLLVNKDQYIKITGSKKYDLVLQNIEVIEQWLQFIKETNHHKMSELREDFATENIKWISNHENSQIMLWAHNGHIKNSYKKTYLFDVKIETLGEKLKNIYNDGYYSIGFDFYKGSFVAIVQGDLSKSYLKSSPKGSFSYEMMKTDIPIGFLDINQAKEDKILSDFISSAIHINLIGGEYLGAVTRNPIIIKDAFDGIIFFETTSAAEFGEVMPLKDGNKALIKSSGIKILALLVLLVILLRAYDNRLPRRSRCDANDTFGNINKKNDVRSFNRLLLRLVKYTHSISSFKYNLLAILALSILMLITLYISPIHIFIVEYSNTDIGFILLNLVLSTLVMFLVLFLVFILPFVLIRKLYKDKKNIIQQICYASLIGALLYATVNMLIVNFVFKDILYYGEIFNILTYMLNSVLGFIIGLIICYSFNLFKTKWEKPILNLVMILLIHKLIILIFEASVFTFKIL